MVPKGLLLMKYVGQLPFVCVSISLGRSLGQFLICLYASSHTTVTTSVYSLLLSPLVLCSIGYLLLCLQFPWPLFLFFFWHNSCFFLLLPSLLYNIFSSALMGSVITSLMVISKYVYLCLLLFLDLEPSGISSWMSLCLISTS